MPPPPPPPPPPVPSLPKLNQTSTTNNNNNVQKVNKTKNEPTDVNALLSQIRQGAKLKKITQINDRSAPTVAGSKSPSTANKQPETKSITPSMFKNGTNPLNLNFKLPTPIGGAASSLNSSNKKPNQSASNLNSASSNLSTKSIKSNQSSTGSTASSLSNNKRVGNLSSTSFNSSANNIAKSLTLRSPSKTSTISDKSSISTKSDRPTIRPPPLPLKPPAVNRRQSFDSGQLAINNNQNKQSSPSMINKPPNAIKPPPPPRFATMKPVLNQSNQINRQQNKSSQNLSTLGSNSNTSATTINNNNNYSTMKLKANTKNYPSTPRPLGAPPPPPIPRAPISNSSNLNTSNNTSSSLSFKNNNFQLNNSHIPPPPPLPNLNLLNNSNVTSAPPPPLPPSITSVKPMSNLSNAFYETINENSSQTIAPAVPQFSRNTSKDLESRFQHQFKDLSFLPPPDSFTGGKKTYATAMGNKTIRSRAPLPPNETQKAGGFQQMLNA